MNMCLWRERFSRCDGLFRVYIFSKSGLHRGIVKLGHLGGRTESEMCSWILKFEDAALHSGRLTEGLALPICPKAWDRAAFYRKAVGKSRSYRKTWLIS